MIHARPAFQLSRQSIAISERSATRDELACRASRRYHRRPADLKRRRLPVIPSAYNSMQSSIIGALIENDTAKRRYWRAEMLDTLACYFLMIYFNAVENTQPAWPCRRNREMMLMTNKRIGSVVPSASPNSAFVPSVVLVIPHHRGGKPRQSPQARNNLLCLSLNSQSRRRYDAPRGIAPPR